MNMPLVLLNRRRRGNVFTPSTLFALAEPGVWYDPSDLTTLFTDTAGTTPVTTPGQTVALALDKSKGLALGPELVTNGGFASSANWLQIGSNVNITGGALVITAAANNAGYYQPSASYAGSVYEITVVVTSISSGAVTVTLGIPSPTGANCFNITAAGTYTFRQANFTADTNLRVYSVGASTTASVDSVSVRSIPGNHATQATAASRPTYGIVPQGGRRNLLTYSENLTDAIWQVSAVTKPTATRIQETATTGVHWVAQTNSLAGTFTFKTELKAAERSFAYVQLGSSGATTGCRAMVDLSAGTILSYTIVGGAGFTAVSSAITSVGDGWYRVVITASHATANNLNPYIGIALDSSTVSYAGNASNGILARNSQLETGSSATAYQRVGSAFDVTEAGVASLSYLSFDGVDDFLVTPTITPGTDKAQVFAGVRKLSDVALGIVVEHSAAYSANAGSFNLTAPDVAGGSRAYAVQSRGNAAANINQRSSTATGAAPNTAVLSGLMDISGDTALLQRNTVASTTATGDQGTGNYLAYPIYIGRRGGTSAPLSGELYSLIVRFGTNLDAGTITSTETWVNSKTGAYT